MRTILLLTVLLGLPLRRGAAAEITLDAGQRALYGGALTVQQDGGAAALRLAVDLEAAERWAIGRVDLKPQYALDAISLRLRGAGVRALALRVTDATGQAHQTYRDLPPAEPALDDEAVWSTLTVSPIGGAGWRTWGGANDRVVHFPLTRLDIIVERQHLTEPEAGRATLTIADLTLHTVGAELLPELLVQPAQIGNIFLTTEAVRIPLLTRADRLRYTVTDYWQREVAGGDLAVTDGQAVLELPGAVGYFRVRLQASLAGAVFAERYTSYAVIAPYTVRDPAAAPWGVMTHFAQGMDPEILPAMRRAGIVSIRDEHYWNQVEKEKEVYAFSERSDRYMAAAAAQGLDPLVALTFANPLYDAGLTPHTDAGREGYGRYADAVLAHYGEQIRWLEVWNEYNGTWCQGPAAADRPASYTALLKTAYEHIKARNPEVQVLGGAAVLIPLPYFEGIFQAGGLRYMDGLVIHPYRGRPEGVDREVAELQALVRQYNDGREIPIWVTETGRQNTDEYEWERGRRMYEAGRAQIASYLARQYALLLKAGAAKVYWYLVRDHQDFVSMGLLRNADEPSGMGRYAVAPAYVSYATLIRQLDGRAYVGNACQQPYTRVYCLHFRDAASADAATDVRMAWATRPSALLLHADAALTVVDLMGGERELAPVDGVARLELGPDPVYVRGAVRAVEEADTGRRYIASSADDYSKAQGENGWQYGYRVGPDGAFTPLSQVQTIWGYEWGGIDGHPYLKQMGGSAHPGEGVWVDRRWTSPVAGAVDLELSATVSDRSDGIDFVLLLDGAEVYRRHVTKAAPLAAAPLTLELAAGAVLDILIGQHDSLDYDATAFDVVISQRSAAAAAAP